MVLFLVGLGLGNEKDITVRGLECVRRCTRVYLESYTSILPGVSKTQLEGFYGRDILVADRELVETGAEQILEFADHEDVALLVVGDPFGATTHADFVLRAHEKGVPVQVVHNASIMNAVGVCGLQLYRFGETVSIPFFTETWRPYSFYDKIRNNRTHGWHTLLLLDIKVKEPTMESLARGKPVYLPPHFMTIDVAIEQLLEVEDARKEGVYSRETLCVGLARVGCADQRIVAGTMEELRHVDFGSPLHSMVIVGETHVVEDEVLALYRMQSKEV